MICITVFITNEIQKSVNMYKIMEKKSMSDNNTNNHQNDVHLMTTHRMNYANSVRNPDRTSKRRSGNRAVRTPFA